MKSVALYARVSSEQQAQQATVESQVAALKERVEADGHVVLPTDVYVDDGYSGSTLLRPALETLRDRTADGGLDLVYVHSPDRLARRYAYQVLLLEELSSQGVAVQFLNAPRGETAEDELLVQVQGMIAEYERAKILERCRRGKLHKARQGSVNPLSGAPYGYLYVRKTETEPARYTVLLHEAKVVRRIFERYVHDQISLGAIVRDLNAQGIPTRRKAPRWDRSTIWGFLRNPAYMGKAAFGKTEAVERRQLLRPIRGKNPVPRRAKSAYRDKPPEEWIYVDVPALVSPELFEAAQDQLRRNRRLSARNGRGERYLLQGLTVCACCGYAYYGKTVSRSSSKGKRQYSYYRCVGTDGYRFAGGRVCDNKQVRVDQLDEYVWRSVRELLENPERVLEEWSRRSEGDGVKDELRQQRDEAARFLATQERIMQRLLDAYEAGVLDLDELKDRSERVRTRIEHARRDLEQAEALFAESIELRAVVSRLQTFADRVNERFDELSWQDRRQLIRLVVARVEIDEDGATVVYRVPEASGAGITGPDGGRGEDGSGGSEESLQLRGRRHDATLGRPTLRPIATRSSLVLVDHRGTKPHSDELQHRAVTDPRAQPRHQLVMRDRVEVSRQIGVVHLRISGLNVFTDLLQRSMGTTAGTESVGTLPEFRLENGLQDKQRCLLNHAITNSRDAQRPLPAIRLRDVDSPHWSRLVALGAELLMEFCHKLPRATLRVENLVDPHSIDPSCTLVAAHPYQCGV